MLEHCGANKRRRVARGWPLVLALSAACSAEAARATEQRDPYRPVLHFTPRRHWMNDPNGPVVVAGRYHLFFQYNPDGTQWGNIGWGHASSSDLLHWREEPMALRRTDSTMIFSGAVVHDSLGTSGLCRGPRCLVAIHTAAHDFTKVQSQALAYSTDGGLQWTPYRGNPVLTTGSTDFRDPWVFRDSANASWVMAVARAREHAIDIYRSPDLRHWTKASSFGPYGATGGVWECPVLLPLPVDSAHGAVQWLLKVDLNPGHPSGGSGAQYFVGTFDGARFVADPHAAVPRWVDHGPDFYCAQPWPVAAWGAERPWIAWMSNWSTANQTPTGTWRGAMTLPRTVSLRTVDGRAQLIQQPVRALADYRGAGAQLRYDHTRIPDATVLQRVPGDVLECELVIVAGAADEVGLLVRHAGATPAGIEAEHVLVAYDARRRVVALDRRPSGNHALPDSIRARFRTRHEAPRVRPVGAGGDTLRLRVIVDRSSVEIFADDGEVVLTGLVFPSPRAQQVALFTKGGEVQHLTVRTWPLQVPPARR